MDALAYIPAVEKKPITRTVRLDADLVAAVDKLKERLDEMKVQRGASWNAALEYALGFLELCGYFTDPDTLIAASHEAAKRKAEADSGKFKKK